MLIFIEHNIWDQLFKRKIDLDIHFPKKEYSLRVTRQGVFEVVQTPDTKIELKKYIKHTVQEDSLFGFGNPNLASNEQRTGGFRGRFSSTAENTYLHIRRIWYKFELTDLGDNWIREPTKVKIKWGSSNSLSKGAGKGVFTVIIHSSGYEVNKELVSSTPGGCLTQKHLNKMPKIKYKVSQSNANKIPVKVDMTYEVVRHKL